MIENKLSIKLKEKIYKGEKISIIDLYGFSSIKLKCSRNRKNFNKYYHKYINDVIFNTYISNLYILSYYNISSNLMNFDLDIVPISDTSNIKIQYLDYKYNLN